jgi:hypothetical protein
MLGIGRDQLGVPVGMLWAEMGHSQGEINIMRALRAEAPVQQCNIGGELLRQFQADGTPGAGGEE